MLSTGGCKHHLSGLTCDFGCLDDRDPEGVPEGGDGPQLRGEAALCHAEEQSRSSAAGYAGVTL